MKKMISLILVLSLLFSGNAVFVYADESKASYEYVTSDEINANPLKYSINVQKRIATFLEYMENEYVIKKRDIYIVPSEQQKGDITNAEKRTILYMDWDSMIKNAQTMKKERKDQIGKTYTVGKAKYKIIAYNKARRVQDLSKKKTVIVPDTIRVGKNTYMVSELADKAFNKKVTKIVIGKYVQLNRNNILRNLPNLTKLESKSQYPCYEVDVSSCSGTISSAWTMTLYNMKKVGKPVTSKTIVEWNPVTNKAANMRAQKYQGKIKDNLEGYTVLDYDGLFAFLTDGWESIILLGKKCTEKIDGFDYKKYDYYYTNAWNGSIIGFPKKATSYILLDTVSGKKTDFVSQDLANGFGKEYYSIWYPRQDGSYTKRMTQTYLDGYFKDEYSDTRLEYNAILSLLYKYRTPNIKINWGSTKENEVKKYDYLASIDFDVSIEVYSSDWSRIKKEAVVNILSDSDYYRRKAKIKEL